MMKRYLFAALGVFFVMLGGIGIWLPLIPTVGPLLLASFFFAKSFPALEERLIRNRYFAKFHGFLDGTAEMTWATKLTTMGTMWLSILISGSVLHFGGRAPVWVLIILVVLGVIGTVVIARLGKQPTSESDSSEMEISDV